MSRAVIGMRKIDLAQIHARHPQLRPSEQRVATVVLADPETVLQQSMAQLAQQAGVSEPTVMRFCQALGAKGFREFKLELARTLAGQLRYAQQALSADDSSATLADKVIEGAMASLEALRVGLDPVALDTAATLLGEARRVECYGLGGAGIVASDAQFKLARLGIPTVAYSDPHCHRVSASLLTAGDVVLAVSNSGANKLLLPSIELALAGGAAVVAVTASDSPLAHLASVTLAADGAQHRYAPIQARIVPMVIIDALVIRIALSGRSLGQLEAVLAEDFIGGD